MTEAVEPAIGMSYSVQVGDGRSLVFQAHIAASAPLENLNHLVDHLRKAADRQVDFGKIEGLDRDIELQQRLEMQLLEGIAAMEENTKRTGRDLSKPEENNRRTTLKSLEQTRKAIDTLREKRAALVKSLG